MITVYKISPTVKHVGGCAIIAAECANDAELLYRAHDAYSNFIFDEANCKVEPIHDLVYTKNKVAIVVDSMQFV